METFVALTNALACNDAVLSLQAFVEDTSKETGAPDLWTSCHIAEQWQSIIFAFPPCAEA